MPAGPTTLGFAYFAAVKLAGYSAAGYVFGKRYRQPSPHPVLFGAARTLLGVAAGLTFGAAVGAIGLRAGLPFYALLAPVRFGEWLLVLWFFFDRGRPGARPRYAAAVAGSLWSYLLDIPAMLSAFTLPGGAWIC